MRYVEKHFDAPVVIQHEQELTSVNLDEASLLKRKETEALDGKPKKGLCPNEWLGTDFFVIKLKTEYGK